MIERAVERLRMLRTTTPMREGPQEALLARLGACHLHLITLLASPTGAALGFRAQGRGEAFADVVAAILAELADPATAGMFGTLARFVDHEHLRLEVVLGRPSWLRAGAGELDGPRVRAALLGEAVPADVVDAVVGAAPLGLDVHTDGVRGSTLAVTSTEGSTETERLLKWPDPPNTRWFTPPSGLELVDWQVAQGIGGDAAKRLGVITAAVERDRPRFVLWQQGDVPGTVVYGF